MPKGHSNVLWMYDEELTILTDCESTTVSSHKERNSYTSDVKALILKDMYMYSDHIHRFVAGKCFSRNRIFLLQQRL